MSLIRQGGDADPLQLIEAKGLLDIIAHYTRSFVLLNRFDSNELQPEPEKAGVGLRFARELEQGKTTLRLDKVNQVLQLCKIG